MHMQFHKDVFLLYGDRCGSMKGVILAAGKGTRMYPLTKEFPKCMLPVAGKPIIEWGINLFRDELKIKEILIIVGFAQDKIRNKFGDGKKYGVNIIYKEQDIEKVYGLGSALLLAEDFVHDDFVLLLGDNLYKGPYRQIVEKHQKYGSRVTLHIEESMDPERYGVVQKESRLSEKLVKLIEKPKSPPTNLVITGFYVLHRMVFDVLKQIPLSDRGELELTDALNIIASKGKAYGIKIDGWRKDLGYPVDLLDASKWYLDNNQMSYINSDIGEDVILIDPVYIGEGSIIKNSTLGPYATIGSNTKIVNSRIIHSVILDNVEINNKTIIDTVKDVEHTIELNLLVETDKQSN